MNGNNVNELVSNSFDRVNKRLEELTDAYDKKIISLKKKSNSIHS